MEKSPLTQTDDVELLRAFDSSFLAEGWARNFGIDITSELRGHQVVRLFRCRRTTLRFFEPSDLAGSPQLYEALQRHAWYYMPAKWEHEVALTRLRPGNRVVEVGCGEGSFVAAGLKKGLDIRGIEINAAAVSTAKKAGLPVDLMDIEDARDAFPDGVDAVCAFQVLEHVPQPRPFIESMLSLLRPGGRLLLCVPNGDGYLSLSPQLLDMPPHHMTQWTREAFRSLSELMPVTLTYSRYEPLTSHHVAGYVAAHWASQVQRRRSLRWVLNRYTALVARGVLRAGLRRLFNGHSLYVELQRSNQI